MTDPLTDEERQALTARYQTAGHAMQSGVALKIQTGSARECEPKHLRVGVNSAMADMSALAWLLVRKGVISERELLTALAEGMEREAKSYQDAAQAILGSNKVTLA